MSGKFQLFLARKGCIEAFRFRFIHEVTGRRMIHAGHTVKKSLLQFLQQEIGDFRIPWLCVIMDPFGAGGNEAACAVEVDIALHADAACTHGGGLLQRIVQKQLAVALPLICGRDTDGPESHHGKITAIVCMDHGPHKQDMPDQLAVLFQNKVQFGDEIGIVAQHMYDVMFQTAGAVDVPECLAGQVFHGAEVSGGFLADQNVVVHSGSS